MARYDEKHKHATRTRILETAGRRLKTDGIDGSGVATLMKDAGLTNGAFYAHFPSKDDLVSEVVRTELQTQREQFAMLPEGTAGVEDLLRYYLSAAHRDDPAQGCVSAALLDEIARGPESTRIAYTHALLAIMDDLEARLHAGSPTGQPDRAHALSVYALMVGTVQIARSLTDEALADQVIEVGLKNALAIFGLTKADDHTADVVGDV